MRSWRGMAEQMGSRWWVVVDTVQTAGTHLHQCLYAHRIADNQKVDGSGTVNVERAEEVCRLEWRSSDG